MQTLSLKMVFLLDPVIKKKTFFSVMLTIIDLNILS